MMRLVCPNCDAEYEVESALIPDTGRDVQCSNCGHAWFQGSPMTEADAEAEEALFAPAAGQDDIELTDDGQPEEEEEDFAPPVAATTSARQVGATRNIDDSVLSVLREEAERESRARQAEAGSLETQDELGLTGPTPAADRIARMKGEAEAEAQPPPEAASSRHGPAKSEMLPEIDAINSTLRAKSERRGGEQVAIAETMGSEEQTRGSFRRGFLVSMTVIVLAMALYLLSPLLAQKFPALVGPLSIYVGFVEGLRGLIDGVLQSAIAKISGMMGDA